MRRESVHESLADGHKSLERVDTQGAAKQTASGRVLMQVTRRFSLVVDEDMVGETQQLQQKEPVVDTTGYNLLFHRPFVISYLALTKTSCLKIHRRETGARCECEMEFSRLVNYSLSV